MKDYIENCRQYELEVALKHLAKGIDPKLVLEKMSMRLCNKMLHPIYKMLSEHFDSPYNNSIRKLEYEEYLKLKNLKPKPDHIADDK